MLVNQTILKTYFGSTPFYWIPEVIIWKSYSDCFEKRLSAFLYTFFSEGGSGNCVDKNFTFNMVTSNGNKMFQELSQCQLLTLGLSTIAFTAIFGGLKRLGLFYQWRHKVGKKKIK